MFVAFLGPIFHWSIQVGIYIDFLSICRSEWRSFRGRLEGKLSFPRYRKAIGELIKKYRENFVRSDPGSRNTGSVAPLKKDIRLASSRPARP